MLHHHNHGSGINTLLGFVFIITLINAYVIRFKENEHVNHSNDEALVKEAARHILYGFDTDEEGFYDSDEEGVDGDPFTEELPPVPRG